MNKLLLRRNDAAKYLAEKGLRISAITLARMAVEGSGPPYALIRHTSYYTTESLDDWLQNQVQLRPHSFAHMQKRNGGCDV